MVCRVYVGLGGEADFGVGDWFAVGKMGERRGGLLCRGLGNL